MRYVSAILLFILYGCSAQYHEKKFYKKGGTFDCVPDSVLVINTVVDSSGNILTTDTVTRTEWKSQVTYVPKYVYRYKYKTEKLHAEVTNDSINEENKTERTKARNENKTERTTVRQENHTERVENRCKWWIWLLIGFGIGIASRYIWKIIKIYLKL